MRKKIYNKNLITTVKDDCDTFKFFVYTTDIMKVVEIQHHTDFTGTCLEKDFPNGSTTTWRVELFKYLSDIEAVNRAGRKLLKVWIPLAE